MSPRDFLGRVMPCSSVALGGRAAPKDGRRSSDVSESKKEEECWFCAESGAKQVTDHLAGVRCCGVIHLFVVAQDERFTTPLGLRGKLARTPGTWAIPQEGVALSQDRLGFLSRQGCRRRPLSTLRSCLPTLSLNRAGAFAAAIVRQRTARHLPGERGGETSRARAPSRDTMVVLWSLVSCEASLLCLLLFYCTILSCCGAACIIPVELLQAPSSGLVLVIPGEARSPTPLER